MLCLNPFSVKAAFIQAVIFPLNFCIIKTAKCTSRFTDSVSMKRKFLVAFSSELLRFSVHNGLLLSITFLITIGLLCSLSPSMCRCRSATLSATMAPVCSNLSGTRLSHAHYLRSSSSLSDVPYRFQVHHVAAFHA